MDADGRLLIYGATGAVGRRLAEIALQQGLAPVLAGRRRAELDAVAGPLACEVRVAGLDEIDTILDGITVVASCVGPYTHFGQPVVEAAIRAGAHYLDLTGEPRYVATLLGEHDAAARAARVTLVPSAGLGLCSSIAARAACDDLEGPVREITIGYLPWAMRPSKGTIQSTVEIVTGGAAVVENGRARFTTAGGIRRTPLGMGARFPLTDPLTMSTMWPAANIDSYLLSRAAPVLAPILMSIGVLGRSVVAMRAVRAVESRLGGPARPGGAFTVSVAIRDSTAMHIATVKIDDTYELTSRAAFEVALGLTGGGTEPGVRASGAVVGDPLEVADRIGVRLHCARDHPGTARDSG